MKNTAEEVRIKLPVEVVHVLRDAAASDGVTVEEFVAVHAVAGVSEWWDSVAGQADNNGVFRLPTGGPSRRQRWYDDVLALNA